MMMMMVMVTEDMELSWALSVCFSFLGSGRVQSMSHPHIHKKHACIHEAGLRTPAERLGIEQRKERRRCRS
mgnify:CR=1 FL=1